MTALSSGQPAEWRTPTQPYRAHDGETNECPVCHSVNADSVKHCDQCGHAMQPKSYVNNMAGVEDMARTEEIKTGDMVHRESVKSVMEQLLRPLREALDKLPLNERTNCNPEKPEIAERALKEWRDRLLLRAKSAVAKF